MSSDRTGRSLCDGDDIVERAGTRRRWRSEASIGTEICHCHTCAAQTAVNECVCIRFAKADAGESRDAGKGPGVSVALHCRIQTLPQTLVV